MKQDLTLRAFRSISSNEQLTLGEPWAILARLECNLTAVKKCYPQPSKFPRQWALPESLSKEGEYFEIWSTMNKKEK